MTVNGLRVCALSAAATAAFSGAHVRWVGQPSEAEVGGTVTIEAIGRLMRGRTAAVIARRLSTVRRAGRIFVLTDGQVVEAGSDATRTGRPDSLYRTLSLLQLEPGDGSLAPVEENACLQAPPPPSG